MKGSEGFHLKDDIPKVLGLECDTSSEASVEKAFTRTIETFGRVDVAIAAAGETSIVILFSPSCLIKVPGIVHNYSAFE